MELFSLAAICLLFLACLAGGLAISFCSFSGTELSREEAAEMYHNLSRTGKRSGDLENGSMPPSILCAAISPDGEQVAAGDLLGNLSIWQIETQVANDHSLPPA